MSYTYTPARQHSVLTQADQPLRPAEKHGVVFTKPWVVELILDLAGYVAEANLVDRLAVEPASGDGAFVLPMVRRLIASAKRYGRPISECADSLIAFEIDPLIAAQAREDVTRLLVGHGVAPGEAAGLAQRWIRIGDSLVELPKLPPADFVIGNPPYIRLEDMNAATMDGYRATYRTMVGRADLFIPFFEAGLAQLKAGGVCAYICADRWMLNQYGAELRRFVTARASVEVVIEMHRADAFALDVSAYPAITVIRRGPQQAAVVASLAANVEAVGSGAIAQALAAVQQGNQDAVNLPGLQAARVETWFSGTDPWPCVSPGRLALLKHLEGEFYPLESAGTGTKVGIGVATGADEVFITTDPGVVEADRLLPLAMAGDTVDGQLRWSGHYLINPWNDHGLVDLGKYPRLATYLDHHRAQLTGRHVGRRQPERWYRTIDRVNHALTAKPKLYIADIKDRLNPVLDPGTTYPHHNLYVVWSVGWDPEVLGGLLLSDIGQFFVACYGVRMRGGYLRFQAQYLRRIRVPRPMDVSPVQADGLRSAFRLRDRALATQLACALYHIDQLPVEEAAWSS